MWVPLSKICQGPCGLSESPEGSSISAGFFHQGLDSETCQGSSCPLTTDNRRPSLIKTPFLVSGITPTGEGHTKGSLEFLVHCGSLWRSRLASLGQPRRGVPKLSCNCRFPVSCICRLRSWHPVLRPFRLTSAWKSNVPNGRPVLLQQLGQCLAA